MIGAGVFAAFAPAAAAAGTGLLVGLGIAAVIAYCNATASAQLAARTRRPAARTSTAGNGSGDWWGFPAGWGFVVGKTASCAAMALTFATYAVPGVLAATGGGGRRAGPGLAQLPRRDQDRPADPRPGRHRPHRLAVVVAAGLLGGEADPGRARSCAGTAASSAGGGPTPNRPGRPPINDIRVPPGRMR